MAIQKLLHVKGIVSWLTSENDYGQATLTLYTPREQVAELLEAQSDICKQYPNANTFCKEIDLNYLKLQDFDIQKYSMQMYAGSPSAEVQYMDVNSKGIKPQDIKSGDEVLAQVYVKHTEHKKEHNVRIRLVKVIKLRGAIYSYTSISKAMVDEGDKALSAQLAEEKKALEVEI